MLCEVAYNRKVGSLTQPGPSAPTLLTRYGTVQLLTPSQNENIKATTTVLLMTQNRTFKNALKMKRMMEYVCSNQGKVLVIVFRKINGNISLTVIKCLTLNTKYFSIMHHFRLLLNVMFYMSIRSVWSKT